MKDYFFSVLLASVVCALSYAVFSGTQYEKYIKYISALIASVIILSPAIKLTGENLDLWWDGINGEVSETFEKSDGEKLMYSYLESEGKEALEKYFYDTILGCFGIKAESVSIIIEYRDGTADIKGGEVRLANENDAAKVYEYLVSNFGEIEWKVS